MMGGMEMSDLLFAVRRQISDPEKSFLQTIVAVGGTNRYTLDYSPVRANSVAVHLDGVEVSEDVAVEEHTGTLIFDHPPKKGVTIAAAGVHTRFFTDSELEKICQDSFEMHTANRTDVLGRTLTLYNLEPLEDLPLQILCAIQCLYVLLTDASYDIDINAPDGVNIPRSERYRQLYELLQLLEARYRDLSSNLNVGMYALEVFTFRRISKRTNRYVPVFRPQEIDDRSMPQRVRLPIPTYGGKIVDDGIPNHDITMLRGDTVVEPIKIETYIPEKARLRAHIKRYRGSSVIVAEFGVTRVDEHNVVLTLPANRSEQFPENMVWDLQMELPPDGGGLSSDFGDDFEKRVITTLVGGWLYVPKDVTVPRMTDYDEPSLAIEPGVTPISTGASWVPQPAGPGL
jgi:hypothetical protein